jgi:hypothetical protein
MNTTFKSVYHKPFVEEIYRQFVETALWCTPTVKPNGEEIEGLDSEYSIDDLSVDCAKTLREICIKFFNECAQLVIEEKDIPEWSQAGHDLWLTIGEYGVGFWDGDWPVNGNKLTEWCEKQNKIDLYIGDDNRIYC